MKFPPLTTILAGLLTAAAAVLPARAEDNLMKPAAPAAVVHFVRGDQLDVSQIVPAPPEPGSLAGRADLETVLQVQAARTPEQVAWANVVEGGDLFATFGADGLLGPQFRVENFRRLPALLKEINDDLRPLVDAAKKQHARRRPQEVDARVQLCVPLSTGGSYPSGHAYNAHMRAAVLAEIFPEKRAALFDRARKVAWGRVLGGVHFPTDLEGGWRLAEAGFAALMKSAAFRAALEACRAEAAAAAHCTDQLRPQRGQGGLLPWHSPPCHHTVSELWQSVSANYGTVPVLVPAFRHSPPVPSGRRDAPAHPHPDTDECPRIKGDWREARARGMIELANDTEGEDRTAIAAQRALGFRETCRVMQFLKKVRW